MSHHAPIRHPSGLLLALVAWAGVLLQLALSIGLAWTNGKTTLQGVVVYLGYFTVLSNILVALVASAPWLAARSRAWRWWAGDAVLGCATTAILLVGIAYHLLLRQVWDPQGLQWLADQVLHYVVPVLALAHWLLTRRRRAVGWAAPLAWCAYPAGFLAYALLRGAWLGSYPYPFIDVGVLGYGRTLLNSLGLLLLYIALGYGVRSLLRPGRADAPPVAAGG